jgi:hypothetical protein
MSTGMSSTESGNGMVSNSTNSFEDTSVSDGWGSASDSGTFQPSVGCTIEYITWSQSNTGECTTDESGNDTTGYTFDYIPGDSTGSSYYNGEDIPPGMGVVLHHSQNYLATLLYPANANTGSVLATVLSSLSWCAEAELGSSPVGLDRISPKVPTPPPPPAPGAGTDWEVTLFDWRAPQTYNPPLTVIDYRGGVTTSVTEGEAGIGFNATGVLANGSAAADTDSSTPMGLPSQEHEKLATFVRNVGASDGVSRNGPQVLTAVHQALVAPGRNPAPVTIPVMAGSEGSGGGGGGGDDEEGDGSEAQGSPLVSPPRTTGGDKPGDKNYFEQFGDWAMSPDPSFKPVEGAPKSSYDPTDDLIKRADQLHNEHAQLTNIILPDENGNDTSGRMGLVYSMMTGTFVVYAGQAALELAVLSGGDLYLLDKALRGASLVCKPVFVKGVGWVMKFFKAGKAEVAASEAEIGAVIAKYNRERAAQEAALKASGKPIEMRPYAVGGGHHIPAKSAFVGAPGYSAKLALAIPKAVLETLEIEHAAITAKQIQYYRAFAQTGRALTWEAMESIETAALMRVGVSFQDALATVRKAIQALKDAGVSAPTRIPWGG